MVAAPPAPRRHAAAPRTPPRERPPLPWLPTLVAAVAVLLAAAPVAAVVQGTAWLGYAAAVVVTVAVVGLATATLAPAVVVGAQVVATVLLVTGVFADSGLLRVLPGAGALGELAALVAGAADQIRTGPAPVPATPEICFLITLAVALVAIAVHFAAVVARAPATAGVPLLVAFAVPTALADDLLPWWALVAGALAFGLLLVVGGDRRRLPGAVAVLAAGVVVALVGGLATVVGTDGRFADAPRARADIGLDPFTALRGQLTRSVPQDLLEVSGLPRPTYLRALTLRDYVPDTGWEAGRPDPGVNLTGPLPVPAGPGEQATIEFDNLGYRDYWLPLYGDPLLVTGVDDEAWAYDRVSGIAYTSLPTEEGGWEEQASLPAPSAAQLRAAGRGGVPPAYLDVSGVDPRVRDLAARITAGRTTDFDRAMALLDHFTGPGSAFSYSLQTAPGNGDDALVEFLTVGRVGYCEQFASAMAVMLRTLGVPARVAIGFTAGSERGDARVIGTGDAHAWVEVWFAGQGWMLFDPTPLSDGRTIEPPYVEEARAESAPDAGPTPPPTPQPEPTPEPAPGAAEPPDAGTDTPDEPATDPGWSVPGWLIGTAVAVLAVALLAATPAAVRALRRKRRLAAVASGGPGAATAAWEELLAESADRGVPGRSSDTVRGTARRIVREHRLDEGAQAALRQVVGAVESSWYGETHPGPRELDDAVAGLRSGIEAGDPLGWRRRLLPGSVLADAQRAVRRPRRGRARTG